MKSKSLSAITIIYTVGNLASKLISFVLVFFITFYLTKEDVGYYDIIVTTAAMLVPILNLQLSDGILRWLLDDNGHSNQVKVFTNTMVIFLASSILYSILYLLISPFLLHDYKLLIYFLLLSQSLFPLIQIYTRGIGNSLLFAISGVVYSFIYTGVTLLVLLTFKLKVDGLLLANIIATIVTAIFIIVAGKMYKYFDIKYFDIKFIKELIHFSLPNMANAYSWWLYSSANRYIILFFLGLEISGIWAISYKLPTIFTIFTSLFFMAWQEKSIREFDSPNRDLYFTNVLDIFISLSLGIIIVITASSRMILSHIVEKSFFSAWHYTSFLLLAGFFQSLSLFYGVGYSYAKETKKILYTTLIGSSVSVVISAILIPLTGLYGAGIGSVIGFLVLFLIRLRQTKKYYTIKFPTSKTIYLLLCVVLCDALNYFDIFFIHIANIIMAIFVFVYTNKTFLIEKLLVVKLIISRRLYGANR